MVSRDGHTLHIDAARTEEEFRRLGVNESLMERVLRQNPEVSTICTMRLTAFNQGK